MKKITIVMREKKLDEQVADFIKNNLIEVFEDYFEINTIFLDHFDEEYLMCSDVILVTVLSILSKINNTLKCDKKNNILLASRTLSRKSLSVINSIPENSNVLVVNTSLETAYDTMTLLYQLGVSHLNFTVYDKGQTDVSKFNYAITPGDNKNVPKSIENIVDIAYRLLDTQTFLNIFTKLNIENEKFVRNLIGYIHRLPKKNTDVDERYLSSYLLSKTLQNVMESSAEGVVIVDNDYKIIYNNKKADDILNSQIQKGKKLDNYLTETICNIVKMGGFSQELIKINNEYILITKTIILSMDEIAGFYFNFNTAQNINESGTNLSTRLKKEGLYARYTFNDILHKTKIMEKCINVAKKVSKTNYTVLIMGETGTGKELMAQSIHNYSNRKNYPFVAINCAALPESLLESELFGYEGGAFTGSRSGGKIGLFEQANNGTIFLDEIGDMSFSLQTKFLRVLQEKQIMRIGSNTVIEINVRVITATNKDLIKEIKRNKFREDLYYRLNVFPIKLPPLRERKEDIFYIFSQFVQSDIKYLDEASAQVLCNHKWPGNLRELKNVADYFKLMKEISCVSNEPIDKNIIETEDYINAILAILYKNIGKGIGRNFLMRELRNQNVKISENRLEKLLADLRTSNYIMRKKGRGGMKLLEEGIKYYKQIKLNNE